MTQKPVLRGEVGARALRVRSDVRGHGQARLCKVLGCRVVLDVDSLRPPPPAALGSEEECEYSET